MKTLVAAFITALLVFMLATAWIEVVQPRLDVLALASSKTRANSAASQNKKNARKTNADFDENDDEDLSDESVRDASSRTSRTAKSKRLDAAKKEQLLAQLEQVKQRETKLIERQATMELLYQDIRRELAEVEEIRRRSADELALAERKAFDAIVKRTEAPAQNSDANPQSKTAIKQKVGAEVSIASAIQELASGGNIRGAADLLSGMKDREVAKILTSLHSRDPSLALRLTDQVQATKQGTVRQ